MQPPSFVHTVRYRIWRQKQSLLGFFVVSYVIIDIEDKHNCKWLLTLLLEDLGDYNQLGWNFKSNILKATLLAIIASMHVYYLDCIYYIQCMS